MISFEIIFVLLITLLAFYLFITEKLSIDAIAILIMVILIITGILTPEEGVSGFSNAATITVLCMFILSVGIQKTGLIQRIGDFLLKYTGRSTSKQLLAVSASAGPVSSILNNTACVAILLPMIIRIAEKTRTHASKLLIPLSYIAMAGGTITILGSSTNILSNDIFKRLGYQPLGIFSIAKLGIIVLLVTIIYFMVLGRFLLPIREPKKDIADPHQRLIYTTQIVISEESPLCFQQVKKSRLLEFGIEIMQIQRRGKVYDRMLDKRRILTDDILLIKGSRLNLLRASDANVIELKALTEFRENKKVGHHLLELMVAGKSSLLSRTISSSHFRTKYKAVVLGLRRGDEAIKKKIESIRLKFGDILLLKATDKSIDKLKQSNDFVFLSDVPGSFRANKLWYAIGIMALVVLLASFHVLPIMVSALVGVILMVAFKVITLEEGYSAVNWDVILLLAGIIPLGIAIEKTGAALLMAEGLISLFDSFPSVILLAAFYLLTTILTEIISNTAAVTILIPIGVSVAQQLNLHPISFVIAIMFAASTSYLTPIGYQTNTMVYSAGNYKFKDFLRVGLPLNVILLVVCVFFINLFWGL